MGKMLNIRFGKIRFGFWRVTFLKIFFLLLPLEDFGMDAVSVQWTIYHVHIEMRQSLLSFNMC